MELSEFQKEIAILILTVGKPMPDAQLEAWFMMLGDLTAEQLKSGIVATVKTHEIAGFPPIGLIRRHAIGRPSSASTISDRCSVAWAAVKQAIATHGGYATITFDDPLVTATIRELGGWVRFCDTEAGDKFDVWLRKDFERTYTALMTLGTSGERAAPLPGICDIANSATGHPNRAVPAEVTIGLPKVPGRLVRGDIPIRLGYTPGPTVIGELAESLSVPDPKPVPIETRSREEQIRIMKERLADENSRESVAQRTIDRLKRLTERLEVGEDIPVTIVRRESTPDGPLTTREPATEGN